MTERKTHRGSAVVAACAVVALLIIGYAVVALGRDDDKRVADPPRWVFDTMPPAGSSSPSASPSVSPTPSTSPSPSPSPKRPSPSPRHTTPVRKQTVKPVPSHTKPPVPPPAAPPADECEPSYDGTPASQAKAGAALAGAADRSYHPSIVGVPAKTITVADNLIKAVAWQESGWQSTIVSCYHAYGLMQVTADTASWMNGSYGTDYDLHSLDGNAALGAEYLAWLIYYFGHFCFDDHYDIGVRDPDHPDLLDAVLAGYNVGIGNVDTADGVVISSEARGYTNAVEALMVSQPWNSTS